MSVMVMETTLKPTLWRTARALANCDRLDLMRLVSAAKGAKGVSELATESGLPIPTASVYLRALNARGLISVVRVGPHVYYGTRPDRSLPTAVRIQKSFARLFALPSLPEDWKERLIPILRAYSNPRREALVRILLTAQPIGYGGLHKASGLCETSLLRHLGVLMASGIVMRGEDGSYSLAKPSNSLSAVFLDACRPPQPTTAFI